MKGGSMSEPSKTHTKTSSESVSPLIGSGMGVAGSILGGGKFTNGVEMTTLGVAVAVVTGWLGVTFCVRRREDNVLVCSSSADPSFSV
jgi:hypothetical protein